MFLTIFKFNNLPDFKIRNLFGQKLGLVQINSIEEYELLINNNLKINSTVNRHLAYCEFIVNSVYVSQEILPLIENNPFDRNSQHSEVA
jgi:hypothetical protein